MPPAVALDQIGTMLSPCSPRISALIWLGGKAGFQRDQRAEAGGVELRAQADRFGRVVLEIIDRQPGEDVHRIGHDEDDRIFLQARGLERIQNLLEERDIAIDQIEPAFVGLSPQAGGDHDHVAVGAFLVIARIDFLIARDARAVQAGRVPRPAAICSLASSR